MDKGLDTPTVMRRDAFERLSPSIKTKAEEIAVKQMEIEIASKRLEEETARLMADQQKIQSLVEELNMLKDDLRKECRDYVTKAL